MDFLSVQFHSTIKRSIILSNLGHITEFVKSTIPLQIRVCVLLLRVRNNHPLLRD